MANFCLLAMEMKAHLLEEPIKKDTHGKDDGPFYSK